MSFNVKLLKNLSENNMVSKITETVIELTGSMREGSSIIDPTILVSGDLSVISSANYMEIEAFGRKYFITNIASVRASLIEISAHVDVLSTYANAIKENTAIIRKQENKYNLYLNDGTFRVYQNPIVATKTFPQGFSGQSIILAIAGN